MFLKHGDVYSERWGNTVNPFHLRTEKSEKKTHLGKKTKKWNDIVSSGTPLYFLP